MTSFISAAYKQCNLSWIELSFITQIILPQSDVAKQTFPTTIPYHIGNFRWYRTDISRKNHGAWLNQFLTPTYRTM